MKSKIFYLIKYPLFLIYLLNCINSFGIQEESEHFIYIYQLPDKSVIDTIKSTLENNYNRVTSDLGVKFFSKIQINIYPTIQQFHDAIGWPDASDWVIGVGNSQIYIVSPLNPGPVHNYSEFFEYVLVHEFTHICTNSISYGIPSWLSEGFACYEAGPKCNRTKILNNYNRLGKVVPTLDNLNGSYDQFVSFNGYDFSFVLVKYLIEKYGLNAIRKFIHSPDDYSVFSGRNEIQIENEWQSYVIDNYINGNEIESEHFADNISIYPNPFKTSFSIKYNIDQKENITFKLFDSKGKLVKKFTENGENNLVSFNAADLPNGLYYFAIVSGAILRTGKVVKK